MKFTLSGSVEGKPAQWVLGEGTHRIGRATVNEIKLPHQSVSREHARIVVDESGARLFDLGSRNGTVVNGQQIQGSASIRPGDRIEVGSVQLHLQSGETPEGVTIFSPELSAAGQIHTTSSLEWDEVKAEIDTSSKVYQTLFHAMHEAGQQLMVSQPVEEIIETMLDLVERLVPRGRILVLLREADGDPVVRAARPKESLSGERIMLSTTLINTVLQNRTSLMVADVQSDPRFRDHQSIIALNLRSAIAAPLFDNEKVIGLIYADTTDPAVRYDRDHLKAFTILANMIAVKITNAQLLVEQREKIRMQQEMEAGKRMQKSVLPASLPAIEGYDIHAQQLPCYETAGDLYDAARLPDGKISVVLGDVSGKGVGAALLMTHVMASFRILYRQSLGMVEIATRLNEQVYASSEMTSFVTIWLGRLDPETHKFEFVNAGHNPGLLICKDGEVRELQATGIPVGLLGDSPFTMTEIELPPGCLLCIFSDGIPEAQSGEEFYGEERFIRVLKAHAEEPLADVAKAIHDDLNAFLGEESPDDDITLMLLRRRG
jgi:sigma-B regulation protein RsbU (phosphoserine phosphatase)